MRRRPWLIAPAGLLALLACAPALAAQPAIPIPGPLDGPLPEFEGGPARARALQVPGARGNRALAPNGRSGSGLAAGNGALSPFRGPLGHDTAAASALQFGTCASIGFDRRGRLVSVCNGPLGPALRLLDPVTLATIDVLTLPLRPSADRTDRGGGTHFIVRRDGSLVVPTYDQSLIEVAVADDSLTQTASIDLAGLLASGEQPFAVAAGFDGRDWVAGSTGTVVVLPRGNGAAQALDLGEPIAEDIATDPSGTYVLTRAALYRIRVGRSGAPKVVWRHRIPSGPPDSAAGRVHPGPGTPPVIVGRRFVAVADGLNPPSVRVLRMRGRGLQRRFCTVPVFAGGEGSVESHLLAAGRSIVVANAYGYESLLTTEGGGTTTGGLARISVGLRGCRVAWTSPEISPSAQAVVSRRTGLIYTLSKPPGFPDAWNLAAIDWRTGHTRFTALAGEGLGRNSEGGPVVLGPDGAAYAGTFGGVIRFADR